MPAPANLNVYNTVTGQVEITVRSGDHLCVMLFQPEIAAKIGEDILAAAAEARRLIASG